MSRPLIRLISPAGSGQRLLHALHLDTASELIAIIQEVVGVGYEVTGDEAVIEAGEDESRGGRIDDLSVFPIRVVPSIRGSTVERIEVPIETTRTPCLPHARAGFIRPRGLERYPGNSVTQKSGPFVDRPACAKGFGGCSVP